MFILIWAQAIFLISVASASNKSTSSDSPGFLENVKSAATNVKADTVIHSETAKKLLLDHIKHDKAVNSLSPTSSHHKSVICDDGGTTPKWHHCYKTMAETHFTVKAVHLDLNACSHSKKCRSRKIDSGVSVMALPCYAVRNLHDKQFMTQAVYWMLDGVKSNYNFVIETETDDSQSVTSFQHIKEMDVSSEILQKIQRILDILDPSKPYETIIKNAQVATKAAYGDEAQKMFIEDAEKSQKTTGVPRLTAEAVADKFTPTSPTSRTSSQASSLFKNDDSVQTLWTNCFRALGNDYFKKRNIQFDFHADWWTVNRWEIKELKVDNNNLPKSSSSTAANDKFVKSQCDCFGVEIPTEKFERKPKKFSLLKGRNEDSVYVSDANGRIIAHVPLLPYSQEDIQFAKSFLALS